MFEYASERPCKNPRCPRTINRDIPKKLLQYCSHCQIYLRDLKTLFPNACFEDLAFMMDHGCVNLTQAARMCGLHIATFSEYIMDGTIRSEKRERSRIIEEGSLCLFQSQRIGLIPLYQAANKLDIKKARFWYLTHKGYIRTIRNAIGLICVRERDLRKIPSLDQQLRRIQNSRKAKPHYARPQSGELSVAQVARILNYIDPNPVRQNWILAGKLKAEKRNRRWYIKKKDFLEFCQLIAIGRIKTFLSTRARAQHYLDSLAPN